jgi:hypothetical protein
VEFGVRLVAAGRNALSLEYLQGCVLFEVVAILVPYKNLYNM